MSFENEKLTTHQNLRICGEPLIIIDLSQWAIIRVSFLLCFKTLLHQNLKPRFTNNFNFPVNSSIYNVSPENLKNNVADNLRQHCLQVYQTTNTDKDSISQSSWQVCDVTDSMVGGRWDRQEAANVSSHVICTIHQITCHGIHIVSWPGQLNW